MTIYLSIAGLTLKLDSQRPLTVSPRFRPFLTEPKNADYTITVKCTDTLPPVPEGANTRGSVQTAWVQGVETVFFTHAWGEPPCICCRVEQERGTVSYLPKAANALLDVGDIFHRFGMEAWLLRKNALILHAAFVKWKGHGIVLCGPSGVGKSTQADLWQQLGARVINGDRTLLRNAAHWQAWGSPVAGTSGLYINESAPVSAIAVLTQGDKPDIQKMTPAEAVKYLYPETAIHHWDRAFGETATDLLLSLVCRIPVYRLTCTQGMETPELFRKKACL